MKLHVSPVNTIKVITLLVLFVFGLAAHADDKRTPDQVVDSVAKQLLTDLEQHREEYRKDPAALHKMIDKYFLASFDTEYAAKRVLARHWREATPAQRKAFINAFYESLVNNYGQALLDFTADRLKILPYRGDPGDTNVTVRSEIRRSNGTVVPVNYSLHKTADGWKAWDVVIEGVSYVKSFQTDFGSEIEQKGLDEVIQRLQSQAQSGSSSSSKAK